jgi:CoA:oxalate CoA-transferase
MSSLSGIRIIELGHYIAAPFCGKILAEHGAEVIKVEPLNGEASRTAAPTYDGVSAYYASMNGGKQSIALNLKTAQGLSVLHRLVLSSDILITNYGPGIPEKLGFGFETLSTLNPRLIMLQLSGFGQTGKFRDRSAFDGAVQAMSGAMHLTGENQRSPLKSGIYIADHVAGLQGALGVMLALQERERTGEGQLVDVAMLDSIMSMMAYEFARTAAGPEGPKRIGNRSANVFASTFPTIDGHVYIAPLAEGMWTRLCNLMERPELCAPDSPYRTPQGRLENYDFLEPAVSQWSQTFTTDEIGRLLEEHRIPFGPVQDLETLMTQEHVADREMIVEVEYEGTLFPVPGIAVKMSREEARQTVSAPSLGADTGRVLALLGYRPQEIKDLIASGVTQGTEQVFA